MRPAAILDIGSSKVVCLSGSTVSKGGVVVHGAGICPYAGYQYGAFLDRDSLHEAIVSAIEKTEQESRSRIRDVALTVPAGFSVLTLSDATITLGNSARRVHSGDLDRLIAVSLKKIKKPEGFVLMHSTPVFFMVDGVTSAEVPEGIVTDELSGLISHMFVREDYIRQIASSLDTIGVEISMCINAQLGEAVMLIPASERVRPALLIDIGYRQTDIAVAESAALTALTTLPVGGYHFAADLAFGLDVPLDAAEQAKRRFVFSLDYADKTEVLRTPDGSKRVSYAAISYILEARASELASLIRKEVEKLNVNMDARPAAYLSGGGLLMMRGSLDFMKKALNLSLKRDMPWTPRLSTPNYCSAFGALDFVLAASRAEEEGPQISQDDSSGKVLKRLTNFLTK
ncbi:MAG: hypothetical protein FWE69_02135 [Clostridiales bacterium]|nr:hypothetical protein [Clostridiales bacterium]